MWSSPSVANGIVYVGSVDDEVYAFGASTSSGLSQIETYAIIAIIIVVAVAIVAAVYLVFSRRKPENLGMHM